MYKAASRSQSSPSGMWIQRRELWLPCLLASTSTLGAILLAFVSFYCFNETRTRSSDPAIWCVLYHYPSSSVAGSILVIIDPGNRGGTGRNRTSIKFQYRNRVQTARQCIPGLCTHGFSQVLTKYISQWAHR